jgi:SAM-dependent methyltransferase
MRKFRPKRYRVSRVDLADRARDAGEWELAARLYREALDRDPDNSPIWVQYGHALKESGKLQDPDKLAQAEFAYRRAVSLDPSSADPYLQLGHVLKLRGKAEQAQAAYLRAFALDPSKSYPLDELRGLGWSEAHIAEVRELAAAKTACTTGSASGQMKVDIWAMPESRNVSPNNASFEFTRPSFQTSSTFSISPGDAQLISDSGLFDPAWYRAQNPDVAATGEDPLAHYLTTGSAEGRRPNSLFDPAWYRAQNPDVVAAAMDPLVHYITHGCAEGRPPRQFTQRHESTFLTLDQTAVDRRFDMPYLKTYNYFGEFINKQHAELVSNVTANGMIDIDIEGWLLPADALKLYELVYFCGGDVLELGTYYGLSTSVAALASQNAGVENVIVTVDLSSDAIARARANLEGRPGAERICALVVDAGKAVRDLADAHRMFDFAFVDHSHAYEHVYDVCRSLNRIMKPGAFCLFHDFNDPRNADAEASDYGVYQGVLEGLDTSSFEFWGIYGCTGLFRRTA